MNPPQVGPAQWCVVQPVGAISVLTHQGSSAGNTQIMGANPRWPPRWADTGGTQASDAGGNQEDMTAS